MPNSQRCKRCRRFIDSTRTGPSGFAHCRHCNFTFRPEEASPPKRDLALRSDLVITAVTPEGSEGNSGSHHFVIKDPVSNRYFRVKPLEHFLITQFDGNTSLETIRRRASEQENVLVSPDVLARFAAKFRELGLLVGEESDPPLEQRQAHHSPDLLQWKRPLANPEGLLDWLYPKVRIAFTAPFLLLMALSITVAAAVAAVNLDEFAFGLGNVVSLEGLLFVLLTVSAVTALHELAHGLTCRHFGGRVTDMGFLLLYLLPCFYCNVGDTYLFRKKRERLWVFFSGGFFELFVWAVAVLGYRVLFPGTLASRMLFVVAAVCAVRTLFNFNPLIKMDGYFLLSEALGISNLRRESLSSFGRVVRRIARLDVEPAPVELSGRRIAGMRGDRFLALFGGSALVYSVLLVAALLAFGGGFVFETYGADALAFYAVALVGLLHKPAITAATAAKEVGQEKWQKLSTGRKRTRFVLLWLGILLVAAFFPWELRITSDLKVLPQEREIVRAPGNGRILRIHAAEGGRVAAGDLILEYDATELLLERRTKEAELAQATEELRLLGKQNPTVREEITVKQRALETARAQEEAAQREFERSRELWTAGLVSKESFDKAENELEEALAKRREAEAEIALVQKSSPESRNQQMEVLHLRDPGAQQAIIGKLEAELARLDDLLERTKIYASVSGTLTTYRFEEKVGDYLEEGAEVCEIANDDRVVLEMPVAEKDIDVIASGQAVKFKVRGYPSRSFHARVDEIAPVATPGSGAGKTSTILVRAYVDNDDKVLKPGMTGVAKIYCGMSFAANILTRDLVRFVRTEFWL